jgi:hypothetical protein
MVAAWLGKDLFPTHLLGDIAWSDLWLSAIGPMTPAYLTQRKQFFKITANSSVVEVAIGVITAIGESLLFTRPIATSTEQSALPVTLTVPTSIFCGGDVPFSYWPIFLPEANLSLLTVREVAFPAACFATIPTEIRALLRPMLLGGNNNLVLLRQEIELSMLNALEKKKKDDPIVQCYNTALAVAPENFYTVEQCAKLLFTKVKYSIC